MFQCAQCTCTTDVFAIRIEHLLLSCDSILVLLALEKCIFAKNWMKWKCDDDNGDWILVISFTYVSNNSGRFALPHSKWVSFALPCPMPIAQRPLPIAYSSVNSSQGKSHSHFSLDMECTFFLTWKMIFARTISVRSALCETCEPEREHISASNTF